MAFAFPPPRLAVKLLILQISLSLFSTAAVGIVAYRVSVGNVVSIANRYSSANLNKFIRQLEGTDKALIRSLVVGINEKGIPAIATSSAGPYAEYRIKRALADTIAENGSLDGLFYASSAGVGYAISRGASIAWPQAKAPPASIGERPYWFGDGRRVYVRFKVYDIDTMKATGELTARLSESFVQDIKNDGASSVPGALLVLAAGSETPLLAIGDVPLREEDLARAVSFADDSGKAATKAFGSGTYALSSLRSPDGRWRIVGIVGLAELKSLSSVIMIGILLAALGALAFTFAVSAIVSRQVSTRIDGLTRSVKALARGEHQTPPAKAYADELGALFDEFKSMAARTETLLARLSSSEQVVEEAQHRALRSEYAAIRARLNPHFVSNSLEMINSIAKIRGQKEISDALCSLGELVYDTMRDNPERVALEIELGHVEKYFDVQRRLFENDIALEIDATEEAKRSLVPDFILQPLVENAIVHGLGPRRHQGKIAIRASVAGGALDLSVEDNGVGMPEAALAAINEGMAPAKGFGLASVMGRMGLVYGAGKCAIEASSSPGEGTAIRLRLPAELAP